MREARWFVALMTPLLASWIGCNAIIGLDPGDPKGEGGGASAGMGGAGASASAMSASSGVGGGCVNCVATPCHTATCVDGACELGTALEGTPCAAPGKVCDGKGTCVACNGPADCATDQECTQNMCVSLDCTDMKQDDTETDIDCGGDACPRCANDKGCHVGSDCLNGVCANHKCVGCGSSTDCAPFGDYCLGNGTCTPENPNAAPCQSDSQCSSGFCDDGVCCNEDCAAVPCSACSAAAKGKGVDGVCEGVSYGLDPKNDCDMSTDPCGNTGACDGMGNCAQAFAFVVCGASGVCNGNTWSGPQCDGKGNCKPVTEDCGNKQCMGTTGCPILCGSNAQCLPSFYCLAYSCDPKGAAGAACQLGPEQCLSGTCTAGTCM